MARRRKPDGAPKGSIDVLVLDHEMQPLPRATVRLVDSGTRRELELTFAKGRGRHRGEGVPAGAYRLRATARGWLSEEREVMVQPGGSDEVVVLGKRGQPTYRRGKVRVPFEPRPELVALTLRSADRLGREDLDRVERELKLRRRDIPPGAPELHLRLLEVGSPSARRMDAVLERLGQHRAVIHVGQVVNIQPQALSFLTGEVLVRFRNDVSDEQSRDLLGEARLEILRAVPYSPNTYHCLMGRAGRYEDLAVLEELADRADVEWAEPNVVTVATPDTVTPLDYLWPGVWDRQLVGTPDAWQGLLNGGKQEYGEPTILLAIPDFGIVTSGGAPTHPEFQGTLSDGRPKVAAFFDFVNMVPNHDNPLGDHGMGTGGTSTARADNPSSVPGVDEGLAGAAPNVQLLAMIPSFNDADVADMYIWAAGFDPQSPRPGAPPQRTQGADVFSSSIGFGSGAPISGIASAMLDFITTFGRGGRGCITCQSAGNADIEFTTYRPYAAYERSIAVGASTLDPAGNEVKAGYSDWGTKLGVCAPSNSNTGPHNPPNAYGVLSCDLPGQGNLFGHPDLTTTLSQAAITGDVAIRVASVVGMAAGMLLIVGAPGAPGWEPLMVTGADPATGTVNLAGGLLNPHPAGTSVAGSTTSGYTNGFGGTSSATPLTAGVACLVLSANPDLTWIEVRQILRDTAHKIDAANTDPVGQWLDQNGNPSRTSGLPPVFSQWNGYGRIDAQAAVNDAFTYSLAQDVVVRDNLADTGTVPTGVPFWDSPDVWVRNASPAVEGAAALPATYGDPGPHQNVLAGQDNWVYVRYRNNGTATSLDFYIRVSIAHYPGLEFTYPASFIPSNRPGTPVPSPMTPGTFLIGQFRDTALPPGSDRIVPVLWPQALIPPATVVVGGSTVTWHPCLLVEVSPHDGPAAAGPHVWDDNNLGQKNVTIIYTDVADSFDLGLVIGSFDLPARDLTLEIDRSRVPGSVSLFVDVVHPGLAAGLQEHLAQSPLGGALQPILWQPSEATAVPGTPMLERASVTEVLAEGGAVVTVTVQGGREIGPNGGGPAPSPDYRMAQVEGRWVALLTGRARCRLPLHGLGRTLLPIRVGGVVGRGTPPGEYPVYVIQRDAAGDITGGAEVRLTVRGGR